MNAHSLYKTIALTLATILVLIISNQSNAVQPGPKFAGKGKGEEMKAARKERKEEIKEKIRERKEAREEKREEFQRGAHQRIDAREANQAKRIEHGIKHGYLTPEELTKLQAQQDAIAKMEENAFADNKLTREEWAELRNALNEASRCIWAEKHDSEGNQMPVYRLGKNVFAKDDLTAKLQDENLDKETARALIKDFKRLLELKRRLSTDELTDEERAKLQAEYNDLLNLYFEVR